MQPVELAPKVHWVGALDPQIRIFDVIMHAPRGTTYNAYLIQGEEKTALVDLSKPAFQQNLIDNVSRIVDPAEIDYLVLNHTEPDHSGCLDCFLKEATRAKVVCSKNAKRFVEALVNHDVCPMLMEGDDEIDLGGRKLRFVSAPFLHWPDTMFTYLEPDGILLPCDFLGAHYCDDRLFNDLVADYSREFKYYFDVIMRPFKPYVLQALDKIAGLDLKMIGPSHGPILREDIGSYIDKYRAWASVPVRGDEKHLVVFYASSYGNTAQMAEGIALGAQEAGMKASLLDLSAVDAGQVVDQIEAADAIAVGSLTINGDAVKPVWDLLSSLATLNLRGKIAAAFGSYAWSGEAPKLIGQRLADLKMKLIGDPLRVNFTPTAEDLTTCRELGRQIAEAVKAGH